MNWLFTPAFCKAKLLEKCLDHIYADPDLPTMHHVIIDNHYPINKEENSAELKRLTMQLPGGIYIDSGKDLGLHQGLNNAIDHLPIDYENDKIIGNDPDDRASFGAFRALIDVMKYDPFMAVCGLNFWVIEQRQKEINFVPAKIGEGKHNVIVHPTVEMWNIAAFNPMLIRACKFQQTYAYYGGLESALYGQWQRYMMHLGYLKDFSSEAGIVDRNDLTLFDPEYRDWKTDHVNGFKGSFEEWLKEKGHGPQKDGG